MDEEKKRARAQENPAETNIWGRIFSVKNVMLFRLISWGIGTILVVVSRFLFENGNGTLWSVSMLYNGIVIIFSCLPVAMTTLIVHIIFNVLYKGPAKKTLQYIFCIILLLVCLIIYECAFVYCTGA